ncbi:MAG: aromatic ring-hydroxylating oxygenase subunit alpha [Burkholderiales bacterium]
MVQIVESVIRGRQEGLKNKIAIVERMSSGFYERERQKIFNRSWLCIAHTLDVPEKHSYRVIDMPTHKTSLLLVRDADGKIQAFHNICRHRGNKLVRAGKGERAHFACGFHGWAFSNKGDLVVVPDAGQFLDLNKNELGLIPVHTEAWEGLVFVNFDAQPRVSLREWIGEEMVDGFSGYFDDKEKLTGYEVEVNCNWNVAISAFLEGYHTAYLHKNTAPDYQGGRANPNRHRPLIETFERHMRYSAPSNKEHKATPAEVAAYKYGRKLTPAFDNDNTGLPPGVNPLKSDSWAFDVIQFFPNFVCLNSNYWHLGMWFWPIDAEHTRIRAERIFYKAKTAGDRLAQAFSKVRAREIIREDMNTLEASQEMLMSGVMQHIVLSNQEIPIQNHFRVADAMLGKA